MTKAETEGKTGTLDLFGKFRESLFMNCLNSHQFYLF